MASTYTTSLQIQKIASGEQSGIWGTSTNNNWDLIEQAVTGVVNIDLTGKSTYTLVPLNGALDEPRNMVLVFSGTPSTTVTIIAPTVNKTYVIQNNCGKQINMTVSGGSQYVSIPYITGGSATQVYCDGLGVSGTGIGFYPVQTNAGGDFSVGGNLTVTGTSTLTGNVSTSGTLVAAKNFSAANTALNGFTASVFVGGILTTTLTVASVSVGAIAAGQVISGTGVTAGTYIVSQSSGTPGGAGTYVVNISQTVSSNTNMAGSQGVSAPQTIFAGNYYGDATYLTGTAAGLSIGGNAATATTATNATNATNATTASTANALNTGNAYTVQTLTVNGNTATNGLYVGNGVIGMGPTRQAMRCDNTLFVQDWSTQSGYFAVGSSNGAVGVTYFTSDARLKENIVPTQSDSLSKISAINFVDFNYKEGHGFDVNTKFVGGVTAQNLQAIDPLWVHELPDDNKTLIPNTSTLLANALHAIAQLNDKVAALEAQLASK